ncbi:insulinase family protein, partial [bacterium]|nr:insulinase family protein [bacterium]
MNIGPYQNETPPQRVTLANGTVILTVPVASAHSVSLGAWLRRGSQDEPAGLGGLAHFLEHMVFKGSRRRSAFDLARLFDSVGASVDAFTTKDHVAFTAKVLPEYFAPTAEALADMILDPAFDPDLVALEQDVVVEEIQEVLDTPEDLLHDAFTARLYGGHPRGRPILGTPASVRCLDAGLLRREHADLFRGANLVVAVAGNVRPGMTEGLCACFEPAGAAPPLPRAPAAVSDDEIGILFDGAEVRDDRLVIDSPVQQCYFEIGNQAVSYLHPDRVPLAMLSNILGGGLSSRIFQAVREREG